MVIKIEKDNVILSIDDTEYSQYKARGYRKLGEPEKVAPDVLEKENKSLKANNEKLKAEIETLKANNEELKAEITKIQKENTALKK